MASDVTGKGGMCFCHRCQKQVNSDLIRKPDMWVWRCPICDTLLDEDFDDEDEPIRFGITKEDM